MARIQVLELPTEVVGDATHTPFAIVIDQVEVTAEVQAYDGTALRHHVEPSDDAAIKDATGAVGVIIHSGILDVA